MTHQVCYTKIKQGETAMRTATLRTSGGSIIVALPKAFLDQLGLGADATVEITLRDDKIVISRRRRGRIGLAARLAMCDPTVPMSAEEREWADAPAVGREWGSPEWREKEKKT
jgi:antitoxin ChpS